MVFCHRNKKGTKTQTLRSWVTESKGTAYIQREFFTALEPVTPHLLSSPFPARIALQVYIAGLCPCPRGPQGGGEYDLTFFAHINSLRIPDTFLGGGI